MEIQNLLTYYDLILCERQIDVLKARHSRRSVRHWNDKLLFYGVSAMLRRDLIGTFCTQYRKFWKRNPEVGVAWGFIFNIFQHMPLPW